MDEQQLKDFIDQLKKILNDRSALKKKADELVASQKNIDAINKRTTQLKKAAGKDKDATDAVEKFTEEVKESVKQHKAFLEQTKNLATAFKGLGRAAFEGEGSISAFTNNFKNTIFGAINSNEDDRCDTYFYYLRFFDIQTIDGDKYLVGVATDYAGEYPNAPYVWKQNKLNQIEEIGNSNIEKYSLNFELRK